jgi:predicted ATP-binding protein involved in virulence
MIALRFDRLSLTNFRCFARCEIDFHPTLTVLVAENGSGKTAVLDGTAAALSVFVNGIYPSETVRRIERNDVRLVLDQQHAMTPCLPTTYEAHGIVHDTLVMWKSTIETYGEKVRPSTHNLKPMKTAAQLFRSDAAILPLIAYYGTGRLWSELRLTEYRRSSVTNVEERVAGYADCLTSSSSLKGTSTWFEHRFQQTASPAHKESLSANLAMVAGVQEAVNKILEPTGWSNLHWNTNLKALTAEHDTQGRLPLFMLSDGVLTMLALVADVARRCASLNPHLRDQASVQTPGVLIIDELDMHLHPRWQQQVLGLLQSAFPALQIIVSTHSPHVLSTVEKSSIRVLHIESSDTSIETPLLQTRGVESADVLASVMDVDPVPQLDESNDLSTYRSLIEDGQANGAKALALRLSLIEHFGESHPVMLECERLIRFQQFRFGKAQPEGA